MKQAQELASKMKEGKLSFDKVYSSPLQRAYRTAEIITEKLNLESPEKLDLLIERDFGIMTGQPQAKIVEMCSPHILATETITYFLSPSRAETFPELLIRAKKLLQVIQNKHSSGNILLVGHGDFGKMLYAAYYDLPWQEVLKLFHFGNSDLIILSPDTTFSEVHVFKSEQVNL